LPARKPCCRMLTIRCCCAAAIGRLCEKCDGKCPICDSYVRPATLVRVCDECNYGSYEGRCVICGGIGVSDAYYCKECTIQEKDVGHGSGCHAAPLTAYISYLYLLLLPQPVPMTGSTMLMHINNADCLLSSAHLHPGCGAACGSCQLLPCPALQRDGCPKIINLGSAKTDLFYERKKYGFRKR
jgi:hypothetical protein